MLGYVWPPEDYPWLSLYRSVVDGKMAARGLEFGNKDTPLRLLFAASSGWHGGVSNLALRRLNWSSSRSELQILSVRSILLASTL